MQGHATGNLFKAEFNVVNVLPSCGGYVITVNYSPGWHTFGCQKLNISNRDEDVELVSVLFRCNTAIWGEVSV